MIGLYFVKNFNMFTQYKILPAPWLVRIPQSEFTSSKNPSVPVKKRLNCSFFFQRSPEMSVFHGSWWFSSMYLLEPGAANSEPHILSKSHDILSAQHPQQISISHTHTHPKKKMHFYFSKTNFHCWSFWWSNPLFSSSSQNPPRQPAPGRLRKRHPFIMVLLNNPYTTR